MNIHFIQHVPFENPGSLIEWAEEKGYRFSFTRTFERENFPPMENFDLLIILGGPMSVHDEDLFPWLREEKKFIRAAIEEGKKVLGICLGAQLVALVLGAKVYPNKIKEIGWWPVRKENLEFENLLSTEFVTFHWHGDTFDLPANSIHLFSTDVCRHQGFLYNKQVAALQFHLEITTELMEAMIDHGQDELIEDIRIQSARQMRELALHHIQKQSAYIRTFVEQFLLLEKQPRPVSIK